MKTIQNNKLIAEFMEFPTRTDSVDDRVLAYYIGDVIKNADNSKNENEKDVFHPEDMLFDTNWNWLMKVVEKIENNEFIKVLFYPNGCKIIKKRECPSDDNYFEISIDSFTKIESVHKSVIEFIKWHNLNK